MKQFLMILLKIYRLLFAPFLGGHCRFYPSCSHYFEGVLKRYNLLKACFFGFRRVLRCHPWKEGGIDFP